MSNEFVKRVFMSYLDDDGTKFDGYVDLLKSDNSAFIKFRTANNIVSIPVARVLKIKEKE